MGGVSSGRNRGTMSYPASPLPYSPLEDEEVTPDDTRTEPGSRVVMPPPPVLVNSREPTLVFCHICQMEVLTKTERKHTTKTHLWAAGLFVFGLFPCFWVPYCFPSSVHADHYCSNCYAYIGSNKPVQKDLPK